MALQMMPDHLHGILYVKEKMGKPLGNVISGFKTGCNKSFREIVASKDLPIATMQQSTEQDSNNKKLGLLFAKGYNDGLLLREGQLVVCNI